jgi:hypothetical protein
MAQYLPPRAADLGLPLASLPGFFSGPRSNHRGLLFFERPFGLGAQLRLSREPAVRKAFRKSAVASFHEAHLRAAFSFSKHEGLAQHYCRAQKPAIDVAGKQRSTPLSEKGCIKVSVTRFVRTIVSLSSK